MKRDWTSQLRLLATHCLFGGMGLAAVTFVGYKFAADNELIAIAYLTVIAVLSPLGGLIGSVLIALGAAACLHYFFALPALSLFVAGFLIISLLIAALFAVLEAAFSGIRDRSKAESALRRSEAYLAEAQKLSLTGSFGWT